MSIFCLSVRQCYDSYVALCCREVTQRTMLYRDTNEHGEAYRHGKKTQFLVSHNFFLAGGNEDGERPLVRQMVRQMVRPLVCQMVLLLVTDFFLEGGGGKRKYNV